jgi:predicted RND superfamily exporter protein
VLAMIPNILPPVCVFGLLGWLGRPLDVGGMMTASVALGISVDDTAHLLTWFKRAGIHGKTTARERIDAALARSAAPIVRTSLILGLAFAVFAFCDFTPIAQFGGLLASLLALALVGDLVLLPALLAGPVGRLFGRGVEQDHTADDEQRAGQL